MTEQEHTVTLIVGLLNAAAHMLDTGRAGKNDTALDDAMCDAYQDVSRARRTLSRTLSGQLMTRTAPASPTPRTLASDIAEDR